MMHPVYEKLSTRFVEILWNLNQKDKEKLTGASTPISKTEQLYWPFRNDYTSPSGSTKKNLKPYSIF